jgi:hypothetical protein
VFWKGRGNEASIKKPAFCSRVLVPEGPLSSHPRATLGLAELVAGVDTNKEPEEAETNQGQLKRQAIGRLNAHVPDIGMEESNRQGRLCEAKYIARLFALVVDLYEVVRHAPCDPRGCQYPALMHVDLASIWEV